jgi:hypothetical protein
MWKNQHSQERLPFAATLPRAFALAKCQIARTPIKKIKKAPSGRLPLAVTFPRAPAAPLALSPSLIVHRQTPLSPITKIGASAPEDKKVRRPQGAFLSR